ncbi:MAG: CPBP family intramembrane glutamic endopeptidase [Promethearchaeota archaeon]
MLSKKRMVVLLSTCILTIIYWITALWYTNKSGYTKDLVIFYAIFGNITNNNPWLDFWQYIYQFAMAVLLFAVIPYLLVKYYLKEDFMDYGLRWGNKKLGLAISIPIAIGLFFVAMYASQDPILQSEYPLSKLVGTNWLIFIFYEFCYFFYFFAYEITMRGYLQWGLKSQDPSKLEIIAILAIQTTITTLFHIGKPMSEIMLALVMGPILGYAALKLNSIWYGMILHYLVNIFNDLFILYWLGMLLSW